MSAPAAEKAWCAEHGLSCAEPDMTYSRHGRKYKNFWYKEMPGDQSYMWVTVEGVEVTINKTFRKEEYWISPADDEDETVDDIGPFPTLRAAYVALMVSKD